MSAITWDVRIDWNNDGVWTGTGEDVSIPTLDTEVTIAYGRDTSRAMSPIAAGAARFTLNNQSRDYSPENASSPIAGNVLPARPVRIQATHSAVTYTLFRGFLDEFDVEAQERVVNTSSLDAIAKFRDVKLSTALSEGITTGTAIGLILDAIDWPSGASNRDLDVGATYIRHWWEEDTDAFTALQRVVASEGPPAVVYVDADGKFTFRDRHHRQTRSASTASQATFRDATTEPILSGITYDHGWRDIINDVAFEVAERQTSGSLSEVWTTEDIITLGASASTTLHVSASDPFKTATTPVSGTDYTLVSGSVSSLTLSRTSGQSTIITITAGAGGAVIDGMRLRAYSAPVARTYRITASSSASQTKYSKRAMPSDLEPVWAGRHDAKAVADLLVLQRADRLPIVVMTLDGGNDDACITQQLARDLSDRITIIETETGLNDTFYIERIEHTISAAGGRLVTLLYCEKVPTEPALFTLGTSVLNTGILAY